ncbi:MAG: peptidoglycan DD-metalloendopeptidase family protein [Candidatus Symbiothrix sp.]|jgi:murein DD-endopeptidase MepM/ murein hydrolase activator NlpD|nr:peptidoglycan DD-metalloendopeptidase family protein [Candidatus Symbiothrix sp.]
MMNIEVMLRKKKTKMMMIGRIFNRLAVAIVLALIVSTNLGAQVNKNELSSDEIKKINDRLKLVADKINLKIETQIMDSVLLALELTEENDDELPADELYEGEWNNEFLKAYSSAFVPDSFRIDVSSFVMPITGKVTSPYGPRRYRFHYGTDLKLQTGDTVYAAFDGKIRVCNYERRGYGNYVVIRHPNGLETVYGHLSKTLVNIDENVQAGQPIALGGNTGRSTGSHLHFEFRFLGQAVDPSEIIDFDRFCTYDDYFVFEKSRSGNSYFNIPFYTKYKPLKGTYVKRYAAIARKNDRSKKSSDVSIPLADGKGAKYHKVKNGDTLSVIARRHGVSVEQICRLNGISKTTILKIGRSLRCS